mgnify:FL=1
MKRYTADTIALLGYLADSLPKSVDTVFREAERGEAEIIIPSICIGEVIYTILKGREMFGVKIPRSKIELFIDLLKESRGIRVVDLELDSWKILLEIDLPELHDRMIVVTHIQEETEAIITNDEEISKLKGIKTVW